MEEWKEYKLGGITSKIGSGATPKGGKESYLGGNIALIRSQNILDFAFTNSGLVYINKDQASKLNNVEVKENDILLNITGDSVARVCIVPQKILPARVNQHVAIIRGNDIVDNRYLLYYLQYIKPYLLSLSQGGATRNALTKKMLEDLDIKVPSKNVQNIIISVLSSLDDKIELNRRINENLEQQAQALFKSWFVDFEPFKDGKFVDSELGMIPEGWKVIETNKFMTISKESINPSKNPNCFYAHYSIPAFDEKSMPIFQYGNEIKSNKQKVSDNMTLVSKLNPRIKRIWFIDKACENAICSTEFIPYISLNNSPYFLYCYLDSDVFYNSIMSSVNGATGSHQRFQANDTLKFLFPYNEEVIYKFNLVVSGILKHKSRLIIESQKLSQLRDTLLPRLMSGKLEIKDNSYD